MWATCCWWKWQRGSKQCVRETDTVARLGGDEFVVMLENLSVEFAQAVGEAERVATPIIQAMQAPFELAGYRHHSSCSIGVSVFLAAGKVWKNCSARRYRRVSGQAAGRGVARFCASHARGAGSAAALGVRTAPGHCRRPVALVLSGADRPRPARARRGGAGALAAPERGLVPPGEFIALAEDTGLILPLGAWVLEEACRQLAVWAQSPATAHLHIAVNVSARQFHQPGFAESVHGLISATAFIHRG